MTEVIEPTGDSTGPADDSTGSGAPDQEVATVLRLVDIVQTVPDGRYRRVVLDGVDLDVGAGPVVNRLGAAESAA